MENEEDLFERLRVLEAENQQLRQYNAYFRHKAGEWDQVCEWLPQVLPPQSASAAALSITDSQSLLDYVSSNSVPLSVSVPSLSFTPSLPWLTFFFFFCG
jgi:hypothetical protein